MKAKTRRGPGRRGRGERAEAARPRGRRFFTLGEVADAVGGELAGDGRLRLAGVETLDRATPADLSWVADARRAAEVGTTRAGALIVASPADAAGKPAIVVALPALALARWIRHWRPAPRPVHGISRAAHVHPSARLGAGVSIAAGATVAARARIGARTVLCAGVFVGEEAQVGEDSYLHPNVAVLDRCRVGARCILHSGAVIGSDGFGFVWDGARHQKIPQVGIVRIEDDVEIGANAAIDRATLGETVIGRGTKIDNLVQIGHNVVVGEHSILCGQAGIAGSARLGGRVTLAGQVGIGDHARVGDGTVATGQAGIVSNATVPPGSFLSGMPAAPHRDFLKRAALIARLPQLVRRLEQLERRAAVAAKGEKAWSSESKKS